MATQRQKQTETENRNENEMYETLSKILYDSGVADEKHPPIMLDTDSFKRSLNKCNNFPTSIVNNWRKENPNDKYNDLPDNDLKLLMTATNKVHPQCWNCGSRKENLQICGKCKIARYCNRGCQREHWKNAHKNECYK